MDNSYRHVLAVVRSGSFSAAARDLHLSQPALSMSIKDLENRLGCEIFVRSRRGAVLTEFGQVAYDKLLAVQVSNKNLVSAAASHLGGRTRLALGVIDSIAFGLMSELDIDSDWLRLVVDNTKQISEQVANAQLDVGYATKPIKLRRDLVYKEIGNEPLVALCAKNYQLNETIRLLAYNIQSNTHRHVLQSLLDGGLKVRPVFYSTDPHLLIEAAREGKGVAVVPRALYDRSSSRGLRTVLDSVEIKRPIVRISRSDRLLPAQLTAIEAQITKKLGDR